MWKRDLEKEMGMAGFRYNWRKIEVVAQNGAGWSMLHWERQGLA